MAYAHLVPQSDISGTIINDRPELAVLVQVRHEVVQSVDAADQIENTLLVVLLVEGLPDVVDTLAENSG